MMKVRWRLELRTSAAEAVIGHGNWENENEPAADTRRSEAKAAKR